MSRIFPTHQTLKYWRAAKVQVMKPQIYDYFLILDFEATCEKDITIEPQEIIELPCLKVNGATLEIESIFHQYIQPRNKLTPFCTELTGILQEMVDGQPFFEDVFRDFCTWLDKEEAWALGRRSTFVTCGDWDLKVALPAQCRHSRIEIPACMKKWINIKKAFAKATGRYPKKNIPDMMQFLNVPMQGRLHSGIDDTKNIHTILKELIKRNYVFR